MTRGVQPSDLCQSRDLRRTPELDTVSFASLPPDDQAEPNRHHQRARREFANRSFFFAAVLFLKLVARSSYWS